MSKIYSYNAKLNNLKFTRETTHPIKLEGQITSRQCLQEALVSKQVIPKICEAFQGRILNKSSKKLHNV